MNQTPITIAILGGYGNTGSQVAALLAELGGFGIVVLGRDAGRARACAEVLNEIGCSARGLAADAGDPDSLRRALDGVDVVLSATSATDHAPAVAEAALAAGCDYFDTHLSSQRKWAALHRLAPTVAEQGRCFIADCGVHPGLPAVMVRACAERIAPTAATVYGSFNLDWQSLSFGRGAAADFADKLCDMAPAAFVDGNWVRSWHNLRRHDFCWPAGVQDCVAMYLEELATLPQQYPGLRETGFFISGFGARIDRLVLPACLGALSLWPGCAPLAGRALLWSLRHWSPPGHWAMLDLDMSGQQDNEPARMFLRVAHQDAYRLTALAVAGTLVQYRDGRRPAGVWTQGGYADPWPLLDFLQAHGAEVKTVDAGSRA